MVAMIQMQVNPHLDLLEDTNQPGNTVASLRKG